MSKKYDPNIQHYKVPDSISNFFFKHKYVSWIINYMPYFKNSLKYKPVMYIKILLSSNEWKVCQPST